MTGAELMRSRVLPELLKHHRHRFPRDEHVELRWDDRIDFWEGDDLVLVLSRVRGVGMDAFYRQAFERIPMREIERMVRDKGSIARRLADAVAYLVTILFPVMPPFRFRHGPHWCREQKPTGRLVSRLWRGRR